MGDGPKESKGQNAGADDVEKTVVVPSGEDATTSRSLGAPPRVALGTPADERHGEAGAEEDATIARGRDDATETRGAGGPPPRVATSSPAAAPAPPAIEGAATLTAAAHPPRSPAAPDPGSAGREIDERSTTVEPVETGDDAPTVFRTATDGDATVVRPRPPARARLLLKNADGTQREIALTAPEITIGRATSCDVILANAEVSRLHARIFVRGDERVLVPVGTRKNTYVNGQAALEERLLRHGDVIQLASEQIVYADREDSRIAQGPPAAARPVRWGRLALGAAVVGAVVVIALFVVRFPPAGMENVRDRSTLDPPLATNRGPDVSGSQAGGAQAPAPGPPAMVEQRPSVPSQPAQTPTHQAEVDKLIYQGDIAFLENRYTSPPESSALYSYREVLKLDPGNERARKQIALMIDRYLGWAERALESNDRARARLYADKAVYIHEQAADVGDPTEVARRLELVTRRLGGSSHK
jgi:hypothetical protein